MSNDNRNDGAESSSRTSINRRKILGALGTTAGISVSSGFVETVSAESVNTSGIRNSTPVKTLLQSVGDPKITGQEVKVYTGKEFSTRIVILNTDVGKVYYRKVISSQTDRFEKGDYSARFQIEDVTKNIRAKLPNKYNNVPLGVRLSVKYGNNDTIITTSVTDEEKEQLSNIIDSNEFDALYIDDYYYIKLKDDVRYKVTGQIDRPDIENSESEQIITEQINYDACFDCGINAPECAANCFFACNLISGDPLSCAECIGTFCLGVDVPACSKCIASLPSDYL